MQQIIEKMLEFSSTVIITVPYFCLINSKLIEEKKQQRMILKPSVFSADYNLTDVNYNCTKLADVSRSTQYHSINAASIHNGNRRTIVSGML